MPASTISTETIEKTIAFHGHWCPGLGLGIRAAEWALTELGKSADEEIVAVVETDMCGVDAIQFLTGCTFGKGNLIYKDYGKNAFTFYRRRDDKAARLVVRPDLHGETSLALGRLHHKKDTEGLTAEEEQLRLSIRAEMAQRVMDLDLEKIFDIKQPAGPAPKKARIMSSLTCRSCGEPVMESRTRRFNEQTLCIPCFDEAERRY